MSAAIALENVPCPRCGSRDSAIVYRARDHLYGLPGTYFASRCAACDLWFQNPRPLPAQLAQLYPPSYAPHAPAAPGRSTAPPRRFAALRRLKRAWAYAHLVHRLGYRHFQGPTLAERAAARLGLLFSASARWRACVDLVPGFVPDGRLLEIGCGNGAQLARLRELGWKHLQGIELSPAAAAEARAAGFDVRVGTIEAALEQFPDAHFDVILSAMVLEHLLDPFATLRAVERKLKPGGELLFSTVIRDSLDGRLFAEYGVSYDFPRHMVFFRKRDLNAMLAGRFERLEDCHHSTPIDFRRPASLRGRPLDRCVGAFFRLPGSELLVRLLARLKLMGRVSYRCRRA